jgi:hypothetical protein
VLQAAGANRPENLQLRTQKFADGERNGRDRCKNSWPRENFMKELSRQFANPKTIGAQVEFSHPRRGRGERGLWRPFHAKCFCKVLLTAEFMV